MTLNSSQRSLASYAAGREARGESQLLPLELNASIGPAKFVDDALLECGVKWGLFNPSGRFKSGALEIEKGKIPLHVASSWETTL